MIRTVATWARMVKFSHSLFALPFALSGTVLAAMREGVRAEQVLWIVVAMFAARNAAMGFNRLADQRFDAANPRTASRELPSGALSRGAVWIVTLLLAALFVFAAFRLQPICGQLSPVALAVIFGYSYTKRFTWGSHLALGLALAMAPIGGWLAITGSFHPVPLLLGLSVLLWVAGFDVIYACQDAEFDRKAGLHSIPSRFGLRSALMIARLLHAATVAGLIAVGIVGELHPVYWAGIVLIAGILIFEHRLVGPDDLSNLDMAFFNMNGIISVVYLVVVLVTAAL